MIYWRNPSCKETLKDITSGFNLRFNVNLYHQPNSNLSNWPCLTIRYYFVNSVFHMDKNVYISSFCTVYPSHLNRLKRWNWTEGNILRSLLSDILSLGVIGYFASQYFLQRVKASVCNMVLGCDCSGIAHCHFVKRNVRYEKKWFLKNKWIVNKL